MRIEAATIVIEPRSVGACLDLAVLFYRRHAREILKLTLVFALPATLLCYRIAHRSDSGLFWGGVVFFFLSPFLGAALVVGAGRGVFGEPFEAGSALRAVGARLGRLLAAVLISRAVIVLCGALCVGIPGLFPAVYYGFLPELLLLEDLKGRRARQRLSDIVRRTYVDLTVRALSILAFMTAMVLSLFTLLDQASGILLGLPILFGRASGALFWEEMRALVFYDPWVLSVLSVTAWLVYPLARLAWFFCYLDVRIRKEGWDVELDFRSEAERLRTAT